MLFDHGACDKSPSKKGYLSLSTPFPDAKNKQASNASLPDDVGDQIANMSESGKENIMYNITSVDAAVNGPVPKELTSVLMLLVDWVKNGSERF
jgi:acid phosphatase class B